MKGLIVSAVVALFAIGASSAAVADEPKHDDKNKSNTSTGTGHGTNSGGTHNNMMMMQQHPTIGGMTGHHHAHVDMSSWHKNWNATHHYHWNVWVGPPGWTYHRWGWGDSLPAAYWGQNYWITSYLNFGLQAPPDGFTWVRYGPDALLIDEDTGEVVQVEYGLFY
jgi:Ni/Co efflux regulator RcnB